MSSSTNSLTNSRGGDSILVALLAERERRKRRSGGSFAGYESAVDFGAEELGEVYTEDVQAVMRSVRDNVVTVARSANSTGKTHGAARIAIAFYKKYSDAQVYTAAAPPEDNLKNLLWGEIGAVVQKHPRLFAGDEVTTLHIARSKRSFITGVTIPASGTSEQREARFSGKHAPHILFIVDEGDAVPPEVYKGIESCMSGGHARLLVMFNPRHESGPVYQMERDRRANVVELSAFNHPNVKTGRDEIPGAVTRETTVRRINEWSRPLVEDEKRDADCFDVPDFLVGVVAKSLNGEPYPPLPSGVRKVTDPALSYMTLGVYPAQGENQLISRAWIANARARFDAYVATHGEVPPAGTQPVMGQDVAELGTDSNVSCFRYGGFVARFVEWSGVDPLVTGEKAANLYRERNALVANVDSTGVGAGVAPHLIRQKCKANRVMVASSPTLKTEQGEFGLLRDQIMWAVREWLRSDPGAMLPPDERLIEELKTPTYSIEKGVIKVMDKAKMRKLLKRSPDRFDALALTFAPEDGKRLVYA
jgi:hypothetical protein